MNRAQRIAIMSACVVIAAALFWSFVGALWWWEMHRAPTPDEWAYGLPQRKADFTLRPLEQALPGVVIPLALLACGVVVMLGGRTSPPEG